MDKKNDENIMRFPSKGKNSSSHPGIRIRSMRFYAPAIKLVDGSFASPWVDHNFEIPATEEEAAGIIKNIINCGGIEGRIGDDHIFVPWPCAAVYFKLIEN
jgi:hypothetical protein